MIIRHSLIVEDSEIFAIQLKSYLMRLPFMAEPQVCGTYGEAMELLHQKSFDILFLDIMLPDFSGLDLLKTFPNLPPTIIMSSHFEFAVESYAIGKSADYILKPFDFDRLLLAVNRALSIKITKNGFADTNFVMVKMGRTMKRFELLDIDYIEASTIYSKIFYKGSPFLVNEIISSLADRLNQRIFIRVHKSYIINTKKITAMDSKYVFIGNFPIPLGKSYRPLFEGVLKLLSNSGEFD